MSDEQEKPPERIYLTRFLDDSKPQFGSFVRKYTANNLTHDPESGVPLRPWDSVEYVRTDHAPAGVWDEAIRAVQSVYMTVEPLKSPDREHYATWQTAVTDCEKALTAARDAALEPKGTKA